VELGPHEKIAVLRLCETLRDDNDVWCARAEGLLGGVDRLRREVEGWEGAPSEALDHVRDRLARLCEGWEGAEGGARTCERTTLGGIETEVAPWDEARRHPQGP
jgi:hypothetical protein